MRKVKIAPVSARPSVLKVLGGEAQDCTEMFKKSDKQRWDVQANWEPRSLISCETVLFYKQDSVQFFFVAVSG